MQIRKTDSQGRRSYYGVFSDDGREVGYFSYLPRARLDGSVFHMCRMATHERVATTSDVPTQHPMGPSLKECRAFALAFAW